MAKSFSLGSIFNEQTLSQVKDTHKVVYLKLEDISPNPSNDDIYSTDGIELLSYSIEDKGLLQPLVVRQIKNSSEPNRDTYEIISGHRRRLAILRIIERNSPKANEFNYVPCIVRSDSTLPSVESSDTSVSLDTEELIDGNLFNRNKTDAEKAKELAIKKEILLERKKRGDTVAGKILEKIADEMGISLHQAKKLNAINQKASDKVKSEFDSGNISTEAAYEFSKVDEQTQNEVLAESKKEKSQKEKSQLTAKDVKDAVQKKTSKENESSNEDSLPYGVFPEKTTQKGEGTAEPKQALSRLSVISRLAFLMKKFQSSSSEILFNESEIKEAQETLNLAYQFIANNKN